MVMKMYVTWHGSQYIIDAKINFGRHISARLFAFSDLALAHLLYRCTKLFLWICSHKRKTYNFKQQAITHNVMQLWDPFSKLFKYSIIPNILYEMPLTSSLVTLCNVQWMNCKGYFINILKSNKWSTVMENTPSYMPYRNFRFHNLMRVTTVIW